MIINAVLDEGLVVTQNAEIVGLHGCIFVQDWQWTMHIWQTHS